MVNYNLARFLSKLMTISFLKEIGKSNVFLKSSKDFGIAPLEPIIKP